MLIIYQLKKNTGSASVRQEPAAHCGGTLDISINLFGLSVFC